MVYTVQFDLYLDDDVIHKDEDIKDSIESAMECINADIDNFKVVNVND